MYYFSAVYELCLTGCGISIRMLSFFYFLAMYVTSLAHLNPLNHIVQICLCVNLGVGPFVMCT